MSALNSIPPEPKPSIIKSLVRTLGKKVLVVFKGKVEVNGILGGFDERMNLHVDNAVMTDERTMDIEALSTVVLRGDSVLLVSAEYLTIQSK